jgi:uncharacterized membrane protein YdjX (TVP38/TMEM64 family)
LVLLLAALIILIWWLNEPISDVLDAAEDVRGWIIGFGPLAPVAYVTFFAAQILIAPLPGSFLSVLGGYLFGFGAGLLLSMLGLSIGVSLAILIGRKLGRPLLERIFDRNELIRLERKLRLRSPLLWFVIFLFPLPDLVIYIAGLGTTPIRLLIPAVLLGRGIGIVIGSSVGTVTAHMPGWFVLVQWLLFLVVGGLAYRFQRPLRYHLLVNLRRTRRMARGLFKSPLGSTVE